LTTPGESIDPASTRDRVTATISSVPTGVNRGGR
jgi:hypothetical protein